MGIDDTNALVFEFNDPYVKKCIKIVNKSNFEILVGLIQQWPKEKFPVVEYIVGAFTLAGGGVQEIVLLLKCGKWMGVNQGRLGVGGEELTGRDVVEEKVKDSKN